MTKRALMRLLSVAAFAALLAVCSTSTAFAADLFNISSPAFKDGDLVQTKSYLGNRVAGDGSQCGGSDVSPPVAWANPPAGTLSFAFTMTMMMGENAWRQPTFPFAQGKLASGFTGYRGFCPPKTDAAHHYVFTVYALDLPPTLTADVTRSDLLASINKHSLGVASMFARIAR